MLIKDIRKATLSDAQSLSTLALSLGQYYNDDDPSGISPYFAKKITPKAFKDYLRDETAYEHYVYEKSSKLVGYFALLNSTHFLYLFVDKEHHKQGIAKALLEYALQVKRRQTYSVNSSLYAVPFYEKIGFVPSAFVQKQHEMHYQPMVWKKI